MKSTLSGLKWRLIELTIQSYASLRTHIFSGCFLLCSGDMATLLWVQIAEFDAWPHLIVSDITLSVGFSAGFLSSLKSKCALPKHKTGNLCLISTFLFSVSQENRAPFAFSWCFQDLFCWSVFGLKWDPHHRVVRFKTLRRPSPTPFYTKSPSWAKAVSVEWLLSLYLRSEFEHYSLAIRIRTLFTCLSDNAAMANLGAVKASLVNAMPWKTGEFSAAAEALGVDRNFSLDGLHLSSLNSCHFCLTLFFWFFLSFSMATFLLLMVPSSIENR